MGLRKMIGKIGVVVDTVPFELDGDALTQIDYNDMKGELLKYSGNYAWVGCVKESASKAASKAEYELDREYAKQDTYYRKLAKEDGSSRKDREIKNDIARSPDYIEKQQELLDARYTEGRVKALLQALSRMESMLVQLSTMKKFEDNIN